MTKIDVCKRDNTNNWVRSKKADGFVCLECVLEGIYGEEIKAEVESIYGGGNANELVGSKTRGFSGRRTSS